MKERDWDWDWWAKSQVTTSFETLTNQWNLLTLPEIWTAQNKSHVFQISQQNVSLPQKDHKHPLHKPRNIVPGWCSRIFPNQVVCQIVSVPVVFWMRRLIKFWQILTHSFIFKGRTRSRGRQRSVGGRRTQGSNGEGIVLWVDFGSGMPPQRDFLRLHYQRNMFLY